MSTQFDTRSALRASSNAGRAVAGKGHRRRDHAAGRHDRQGAIPEGLEVQQERLLDLAGRVRHAGRNRVHKYIRSQFC